MAPKLPEGARASPSSFQCAELGAWPCAPAVAARVLPSEQAKAGASRRSRGCVPRGGQRGGGRRAARGSKLLQGAAATTVGPLTAGTPEDKMRLFLIFYISAQQPPSEADMEQYRKALTDAGCSLDPLNYIKQWKAFTKMASAPLSYGSSSAKSKSLLSRVMNTGSQFVMEGVKNLVLKQLNLPVTRILDNLMEMKSSPETDEYRYLDPKMLRGSDSSVPRNKNPFQEAIVFVVGGGNYIEYQNLLDYIKTKQGKHVLYGCSELFNASQFVKQLSQLGQK